MNTPTTNKKGQLYFRNPLAAFGKEIVGKATFLMVFVLCVFMNAGAQYAPIKQAAKHADKKVPVWDAFTNTAYAYTKGPRLLTVQDADEPLAGLSVTISGTTSTCLSNGTVTAQVTGSTGAVTYELLDGTGTLIPNKTQVDNNLYTDLSAGTYQVRVSDAVSSNVLSNKMPITSSYQALQLTTTGITPMPQYSVYSCTSSITEGYLYVYIKQGTGNGPYKVTLYNGTGTVLSDTLILPANTYTGVINNLSNGTYKVGVTDACNSYVASGAVTISNATTISYPSTITSLINSTPNYTKSTVTTCGNGLDFYTTFFNPYYTYNDTVYTFIEFPAGNYSDTSYRNGPNMHLKFPTALKPVDINGITYKVWVRDPCTKKWTSTSTYKFPDGSLNVSTNASSTAASNNCDSIVPYIKVTWGTATNSNLNYCYDIKLTLVKNDAPGVKLKDTTLTGTQTINDDKFYKPTSSGDYTVTLTDGNGNTETQIVTIKALAPSKLTFGNNAVFADCSLSSKVYQSQAYGFLPNTTYPVTIRLLNTVAVPNAETAYQPVQILQAPAQSNDWQNLFGYIPVPFTTGTVYTQPNFYDTVKYEVSWPGCSRKDTAIVTFTAQKFKYKSAKFTGSSLAVGSGGCSANAANVTLTYKITDTTGATVLAYGDMLIRQLPIGGYVNSSGSTTFNNLAPNTYQFAIAPNASPASGTWNTGAYLPATCAYWDTITVVVPKLNAPSIDVSKTYGIICAGQPANSGKLTITAVGYGPFKYAIGPKGAGTFGVDSTSNVFNNLAAGDYDIRLTDACGSKVVQTVQVVNASDLVKINISSVNNSLIACSNDNVTLQLNALGSVSNIVWTLPDNSTVNDVTSLSIPNFNAANTGTYSVAVQSAAGCPASASTNMTLARSFGLQVTSPAAICKGTIVDLTASAITAGSNNIATWAAYTNATATTAVTNPATAAPTATTTYYIKGLSPDACVAIKPITVTVNDKATLGTLAKPAAVCSGTALALTAPTVTTNGSPLNGAGKWYLNNVAFDPATLVSTTDNNKTLYYSVVTDCGTTQTNSVTITVNAANSFTLQTATGTDNQSMCTGTALTTTKFQLAGTATGVSLTGTLPTGVSGSYSGGVYTISGTPTSVGTYNYTLTSTGGTCAPATVSGTITVSGTPSIAATTLPATVCAGSPLALVAPVVTANGATVTDPHWELGTGTTRIDGSTLMTYADNGKSLRYVITSTCGGPTITRTVGNITVKDIPVITITQPAAVCSGNTLTLPTPSITANGSNYTSAHWELDGVAVSTPLTVTTADAGKMLAYVVTADCGGSVSSNKVAVAINPDVALALTSTDKDAILCINTALTAITYSVTNGSAATVTGLPTGVTGTYNSSTKVVTISGTPTVSGTFTYTVNATGTCKADSKTGTITVNGVPTISTPVVPAAVCAGNPLILTDPTITTKGSSISNAHWELNGTTITSATLMTYANNGQTLKYVLTAGCGNTISSSGVTITVKDAPVITITAPVAVCSGSALALPTPTITTNGSTTSNPHWELDGVTVSTPITVTASDAGKMLAYVVTADCGGSVSSNKVAVAINPDVALALTSTDKDATLCINTALTAITYSVTNGSAATVSGLPTGVTGTYNSSTKVVTISGTPTVSGTFTYTVNATGTCKADSKTGTITVNGVPTISAPIVPAVVCAGSPLALTDPIITTNGSSISNAHWELNGTTITTATAMTYANNGQTLKYVLTAGCGNTISSSGVTITVKNAPVITITAPVAVCSGSALALPTPTITTNGSTTSNPHWELDGLTVSTPITVTASDAGKMLAYVVTADCGGSVSSNKVAIAVNPIPVVNDINNSVVCNNTATTAIGFSGNVSGATYTWTNSNTTIGLAAGGTGDISSFTGVNTGNAPVTATVTVTPSANTCSGSSKNFTITVNPTPTVNTITNKVICNNAATAAISFNGSVSGATYTWTNDNTAIGLAASGTGDIPSFTAVNPGSAPVTATITVTPSANTCGGASKTFTITVNPTPAVNDINNSVVCNNATTAAISFSGSVSSATYTWTNNNTAIGLAASGTGDIPSFTAVNPGSAPVTATITVTPSANTCGGASKTFTITVNPTPVLNDITNSVVCNNAATAAISFSSNVSGATYTWTNDNTTIGLAASGTGDIPSFMAANTGSAPATATITVTPNANTCGGISKTFTITVNPTPTVDPITNKVVCNGAASAAIGFSGNVNGATYTWTNSNTAIGLAATGTGDIPSFTAVNAGSAAVIATITVTPNANTCGGVSKTFTITVNPTPTVNPVANSVVCNNALTSAISFNGTVSGTTYTWTNDNTAIGLAASGTGDIPPFTAVNPSSTPVTATITVTPGANTCEGAYRTFTITVNPTPTVNAISNQVICNGAATTRVQFDGSVANTTYSWTNSNTTIGLPVSGQGDVPVFTGVNGGITPVVANITVTPSANTCGGSSQSFTITVNPDVHLTLSAGNSSQVTNINMPVANVKYTVVNEKNVVVTGLPAGVTYNYSAGNVIISGTPTESGTFNYTVSATGDCGKAELTGIIIVNPDSDIKLISDVGTDAQILCINKPIATIIYQVDNATNITVTGLPDNVTYNINGGTVTITGTPTISGKFNYEVVATGLANPATRGGTITVNPDLTLVHDKGNESQVVCINKSIAAITYNVANASDVTVTGLPSGVNYTVNAGVVAISGAPSKAGTFSYTVNAAGVCNSPLLLTGIITVNPDATIALRSGNNNQTLCINNNITAITYKTTNATNVTAGGLPVGVSGNYDPATGSFVISGVSTQSGTFNYTVTATGICEPATLNGTITVSPDVKLTLSSANNDQTVNINDPIAGISYTIANESNAVVTGLPAGVTYNYLAGNIIISGTPTESGTFDYTVTATGACKKAELTGTIIVNPDSDIKLISDKGTDAQILCINNPIVTITYQVDNATNITVTGLPDNVTYNVNGSTVTITGTPTISGKFNYVVTVTGLAKPATREGSITVNPDVKLTHGTGSESQVLCINKAITAIKYTAVNATKATVSGLPAGVNGNYDPSTGAVVISGTPTESGTFNYTVTATGLCLPAQLSGKIVVNPDATIALTSGSNNQTLCINNNIATITFNASNATNVTASGLPAGVNGNYDPVSGSFVISGAPTQSGTFNYTVTATGICDPASLNGTITINADATLKYSAGNDNQVVCINKVITAITYNAANATGVNVTGLPAGVNYDYNNGVITISGTPTVSGKFNYSVTATGICKSSPSLTGIIEIKPDVVIITTAGADKQTVCNHTTIVPINYTTANADSATVSGLPAGVTYSYTGNTILISGIPTESGTFTYTVTATGDCEKAEVTGTLEVKVAPVIATTSIAPVCAPNTVNLTTGITNYDANNYTYTFTDAGGVPVVNPLAVSVAGTYTVAAQNKTSNCTADPQTIQVVINPKPVVNMVTLSPGEVCAPATVNIQSLITNYDAAKYTYNYTDQSGNAVAVPTAISASGNYNITATDNVNSTHCSSQSVTVTVTVHPQPVVTLANNGAVALCGNSATVNLTSSITNYNTAKYNYIFTDGSGNILSNVSAISLPGTYTVKAIDNGTGCSSDKMTLTLTRYALPTVTTTDPASVYDPYTVDITTPAITAGSASGLAFTYYDGNSQVISNTAAQKISGPGSYTYYIQGTTVQGCKSNIAPVHVVIKDRPVLSISSAEIMEGQTAILTVSLPANVTIPDPVVIVLDADHTSSTIRIGDYTMPGSVTLPSGQNSVTFNVKTWDNNVLDLDRILDIQGINSIYKVTNGTVLIHDSTSLKPQNKVITIGRDTIYGKGTAAVSVRLPYGITTSYPLSISVYSAGGTTISSSDYDMPATVTIQPNSNSSALNVTVKNTVSDDRLLNIRGEALGFTVKDGSVYIRKSRINVIPLVSDNGDGINDYLKIENIDKYVNKAGTGGNKVILFNRWEDVIYEADNYDNAAVKFDGRGNKHGAGRVPDGVYFYVITIEVPDNDLAPGEAKKQTFKGYFRLQK